MPRPLAEDVVRLIRAYHGEGYRVTSIAKALKVSRKAVSDVVNLKTHRQIKNPNLPPLRRVQIDRTPIRADGRTDAEINAALRKSSGRRAAPTLIATVELLRAQEAERDRIRALSEPAGDAPAEAPPIEGREVDAPADALAEPLEPLQQDQGAQVDDVPVVDDAVDESDDAPAEAPPSVGREVDAPADALAAPEPAAAAERPYWPMPWPRMTDRRDT